MGRTPPDASADALAGAAAHDINNALTGIFGGLDFAYEALARGRTDRLAEDLHQIREAADRLVDLSRALEERARSAPPAPTPRTGPPRVADPALRGRVLVIDDEPTIVEVIAQALGPAHDVTTCESSTVALAGLRAGDEYDVILCDLTMAEHDGPAVYEALHSFAPALVDRVIFMTGGACTPRARAFLEGYGGHRLDKPFALPALRELVADMVARVRRDAARGIG
ncbi:MAG: response regulator [Myxococcota bacterium]